MDPKTVPVPLNPDLSQLLYSEIQYSEVQRKHIVSKPMKEMVRDVDRWLDSFIE
jgi:hypothetical protein